MTVDEDVRCADGCGQVATCERLEGMVGDTEVVELVCVDCARKDTV